MRLIKFLVFFILTLVFGLQFSSCDKDPHDFQMRRSSLSDLNSLVVFFKKETTQSQINAFLNNELSVMRPDGTHASLEGIAFIGSVRIDNYEGYGINFSTVATSDQRERIKKIIKDSPIVFKLYENVVPNEIKDLSKPDH